MPEPFRLALIVMFFNALRVNVPELQLTSALTLMSPKLFRVRLPEGLMAPVVVSAPPVATINPLPEELNVPSVAVPAAPMLSEFTSVPVKLSALPDKEVTL